MNPLFVYVACAEEGAADVFLLDGVSGTLGRVGRTPGLDTVRSMAINANTGVLYAGMNTAVPQLRSFTIDAATGELAAQSAVDLPATNTYLSLSGDGSQLYSASYANGVVASAPANAHGALAEGPVVAGTPGPQTHSVLSSPDGRHVYAASLGGDRVVWYAPGTHGALEETGSVASPQGSGPRHFRFSPDGSKMYLLHEMSGVVSVFNRSPKTGQLTEVQSLESVPAELGLGLGTIHAPSAPPVDPTISPIWCADVQLADSFLFTTERTSSTVTTFAVDATTGLLEYLRTTATETQPRGAGVTPSGKFLLVCGEKSHGVSVYRIDPDTGVLTSTDRVETGRGPMWIECHVPQ